MFVMFVIVVIGLGTKEIYECVATESDNDRAAEVLPPFSAALKSGRIANEDDDYKMDVKENLQKLQSVFAAAVQLHYDQKLPPFDSTETADKVFHCIQSHSGEGSKTLLDRSKLYGAGRVSIDNRLGRSATRSHLSETSMHVDYSHRSPRYRP